MLCKACDEIFRKISQGISDIRVTDDSINLHHASLTSLKQAAAVGCPICQQSLHHCQKRDGVSDDWSVSYRSYDLVRGQGYHVAVDFYRGPIATGQPLPRGEGFIDFYAVFSSLYKINLDITQRSHSPSPSEAIQTCKSWLSMCIDAHDECAANTSPASYPTRLLDLADLKIRLIKSSDHKLHGPYAALSYAWGNQLSFLRLTGSNIGDLFSNIPQDSMPQVFQEVINIVRGLSIRFLWIDALCIIQEGEESLEDWRKESARMDEVYSNSAICIAASRARDPEDSCYGDRGCFITPTEISGYGLNIDDDRFTLLSWSHYVDGLHQMPLGSRAWAFQERLLPPRVLSFGRSELFWDCNTQPNVCETFPAGPPEVMVTPLASPSSGPRPLLYEFPLAKSPITPGRSPATLTSVLTPSIFRSTLVKASHRIWYGLITEYNKKVLTYPVKDKLVALSAIASRVAVAFSDVYIAGHFWQMLPHSLMWEYFPVTHFPKPLRRFNRLKQYEESREPCPIPSWSWASVEGDLNFRFCETVPRKYTLATPNEYTLELASSSDPCGEIISASLQLTGMVSKFHLERSLTTKKVWNFQEYRLRTNVDDLQSEKHCKDTVLVLFPVHANTFHWRGLMLRSVNGGHLDCYVRIGTFRFELFGDVGLEERARERKVEEGFRSLFNPEMRIITVI